MKLLNMRLPLFYIYMWSVLITTQDNTLIRFKDLEVKKLNEMMFKPLDPQVAKC